LETRTIVIIEDDSDIREALSVIFRGAGFSVQAFATGLEGVEAVRTFRPEVVTVDLGLPDIDGFEVARRVRLFSNAYILMLTARSQELDTLLGLEAGADDYLTKPFRPRELRYRVEALLRRPRLRSDTTSLTASPLAPPTADVLRHEDPPGSSGVLEHNGLRLSPVSRTVELNGAELRLTATEFDLLRVLLGGGRTVQSKEALATQVLHAGKRSEDGFGRDADDQVLQVHIANLRRKLGDAAGDPRWVETVHGFGYRLAAEKSAVPAPD
jgi:DNA-binding response OmpR family regulator